MTSPSKLSSARRTAERILRDPKKSKFEKSVAAHALAYLPKLPRPLRLKDIRLGLIAPNQDDPEEMQIAREAGFVIDPVHHRNSS